jgi:hypothetical protein
METKIGPDFRRPFRGLTTIQLFDKNTGELIEEYHDENTYNDRLQYINYLDTVLKCKNSSIPSMVTTFTGLNNDTIANKSSEFFFDVLSSRNISGGTGLRARQLFATLWLTNNTKAETAHGYPNGLPVGIADTAGVSSKYISYACSGMLNLSESYIGNDRLHLVFDFATDKCNVQFDAVWLFPSMSRSDSYDIATFYQSRVIASEELDTQLLSKYNFFAANHRINGIYTVLGYSDNKAGSSSSSTAALQILNNSTGEIVSTVEFTDLKNIYAPMYYDAGTNTLYTLRTGTYLSTILDTNSDTCALYKLDMSSGTFTKVDTMYNLLGLRWSDFNAVARPTNSTFTFVNAFKKDGSVATIFRLRCESATDHSMKNYFVLFNFDPVTEKFTQVKKFEVFSDNAWNSNYMFMVDDIVYLAHPLSSTQQTDYKFSAFDIKTGAVKSTNIISPHREILSDSWLDNDSVYRLHDQVTNRRAVCVTSNSQNVAGSKVYKYIYFTAPWSTHNKLTSAIKKTDMTTMKIQYDIIWDSIPDVIVPALL